MDVLEALDEGLAFEHAFAKVFVSGGIDQPTSAFPETGMPAKGIAVSSRRDSNSA
jgi:hypothetical protein